MVSAVPLLVSTKTTGLRVSMVPSDTEEDNAEAEASTPSITQSVQETAPVAETPPPVHQLPAAREPKNQLALGKTPVTDSMRLTGWTFSSPAGQVVQEQDKKIISWNVNAKIIF